MKKLLCVILLLVLVVTCSSAGCIGQKATVEITKVNSELETGIFSTSTYDITVLAYNPSSVNAKNLIIYFSVIDPNGKIVDTQTYRVGTLGAGDSKKISVTMSTPKKLSSASCEYRWEWE